MTHLHVKELEDIIKYDDNEINVEHLLDTPGGKVKLVAIKKGQQIPPHTSPGDAMVIVIDGKILFNIDHEGEMNCTECGCSITECENHELEIKKGEFLRFHKDEKHFIKAEKDSKLLVIQLY